jgi:hypothetical protein
MKNKIKMETCRMNQQKKKKKNNNNILKKKLENYKNN